MTAMLSHAQISTMLALALGYAAAHAAGLLTKTHAPQWVFGLVTVVLSTLAGVLPTVVWNASDSWKVYLGNVLGAVFFAGIAHDSKIPTALKAGTRGLVG